MRSACFCALTVFLFVGCFDTISPKKIKFDSQQWQKVEAIEQRNVRSQMLEDIINNKTLVGLSRSEIVNLLGNPVDDHQVDGWDLAYLVGPDRGYGIDFEWLCIQFGSDNTCAKVDTVTQ